MNLIIDNKHNKKKCQKFTPLNEVKDMLDLAGYTYGLFGKTVLELGSRLNHTRRAMSLLHREVDLDTASFHGTVNIFISSMKLLRRSLTMRFQIIALKFGTLFRRCRMVSRVRISVPTFICRSMDAICMRQIVDMIAWRFSGLEKMVR